MRSLLTWVEITDATNVEIILIFPPVSADDATTDVVGFPPSTSILGKGMTSLLHHSLYTWGYLYGSGVLEGHVVLFSTVHGVISIHLTSPLPPSSTSFSQPLSQSHTR